MTARAEMGAGVGNGQGVCGKGEREGRLEPGWREEMKMEWRKRTENWMGACSGFGWDRVNSLSLVAGWG